MVAVGTAFGQVRLYDPNQGRRPLAMTTVVGDGDARRFRAERSTTTGCAVDFRVTQLRRWCNQQFLQIAPLTCSAYALVPAVLLGNRRVVASAKGNTSGYAPQSAAAVPANSTASPSFRFTSIYGRPLSRWATAGSEGGPFSTPRGPSVSRSVPR